MSISSQPDNLTIVYGVTSSSTNDMTIKLGRMVDEHVLILPGRYDGVSTTRSCDQGLWLYLHFYEPFNRQTSQEEWPPCTNSLQLIITSLQLHDMASIYGFIFTSKNRIATRLSRMVHQHALIVPYRWLWCR